MGIATAAFATVTGANVIAEKNRQAVERREAQGRKTAWTVTGCLGLGALGTSALAWYNDWNPFQACANPKPESASSEPTGNRRYRAVNNSKKKSGSGNIVVIVVIVAVILIAVGIGLYFYCRNTGSDFYPEM